MEVIDVFSCFDGEHPVIQPGAVRYLIGSYGDPGFDPLHLRGQLAGFPRAVGGLLPVLGQNARDLALELEDRYWRGLLLTTPLASRPAVPHGLLDELVLDVLTWPEAEDLPIVIECGLEGFSRPDHLKAFLERCPPRPVVLTHGGQLNISGGHLEAAGELFKRHPHTYLETSGIYRQDFLEAMLAALGPERILYGSGYPLMDEALEQERVAILPASDEARAAMFAKNAARLFRL